MKGAARGLDGEVAGGMMEVLVTVEVCILKLLGQQLAETPGYRVFAAAQSQTVHLQI